MSQTFTLQDSTVTDLKTALAGTAPVPTPVTPAPPPASGSPVPWTVSATSPLATLVNGPDGPILMVGYDPNLKAPTLYLRSYVVGDSKQGKYAGSFVVFQCLKDDGTIGSAVALNPGYVDGTPGKEQGDLDIVIPVDGQSVNVSICGRYTPVGSTVSQPPGVLVWPPDLMQLGSAINRYAGAGFKILPVRPGMPPAATGCVDVGGVYVPTYP